MNTRPNVLVEYGRSIYILTYATGRKAQQIIRLLQSQIPTDITERAVAYYVVCPGPEQFDACVSIVLTGAKIADLPDVFVQKVERYTLFREELTQSDAKDYKLDKPTTPTTIVSLYLDGVHLDWVKDTAADVCGLELNDAQATEILSDPHVKAALATGGADTVSRETVADFLSKKIMGEPWPTYSTPGFNVFLASFLHKAANMGYKNAL